MSDRILKVNHLIRQTLGQLINEEIELPENTIITITGVKTASDLSQVKVFVSVIPEDKQYKVIGILIKSAKHLHSLLNKEIVLKKIPKLVFVPDNSESQAEDIDKILDNLDI